MTRTVAFAAVLLMGGCQSPEETAALGEPVLPSIENSKDFRDYVLHFNAQTTDRLPAEIAMEHGISRSSSHGMLTVSVLKKQEGSVGVPVMANVRTSAVNLTGQYKELVPRAILEGDAIYYIAETAVRDGETLIFTISVTPENEPEPLNVRYMKQFFVDNAAR